MITVSCRFYKANIYIKIFHKQRFAVELELSVKSRISESRLVRTRAEIFACGQNSDLIFAM